MNSRLVSKALSLLTAIISLSMAWPLLWAIRDGTSDVAPFVISMILGLTLSGLLLFAGRREQFRDMGIREAFTVVSLAWILASAVGALPYYLHGGIPDYTDAFFEAMSGFTTTGGSILTDIEALPRGLLFWRGLTHWIGGMGIIVLSLAILPFIGVGGIHLYKAEVPGFVVEKLTPRLHETALRLWGIYLFLTAAETVLLLFGGMSLFDALTHSFSTMATGGFSPLNKSVSFYDSAYIDWVITFFMFISGVNFVLHYRFLLGEFDAYRVDEECTFYTGVVLFSIVTTAVLLVREGFYASLGESLRYSAFQVVSVITSTGFFTADYEQWPAYTSFLLFLLMFVGGSTGSTAGGLKCLRVLTLARIAKREMALSLHPQGIFQIQVRRKTAREGTLSSVATFFFLYMVVFVAGALVMAALGLDFVTAVSSSAAAIGNTGPGFGAIGPTDSFASIPAAGKWVLSLLMLMGRLELYAVLLILRPSLWRK